MSSTRNSILIAAAILLVVVNVVAFVLPLPHTAVFWISDIFAVAAIVLQVVAINLTMGNENSVRSRVYGMPIAKVGFNYLCVQLIVSVVMILCNGFCPTWIAVLLDVILLAAGCIGVLFTQNTRDVIEQIELHTEQQTAFMKQYRIRVGVLAGTVADPVLKNRLAKYEEEISCSDPVSSPDLCSIENAMWNNLERLEQALSLGSNGMLEAENLLSALENQLIQRNALCRSYKKSSMSQGTQFES